MNTYLAGKTVLITGGTGSLGHALVRRLLRAPSDAPELIRVYSRDESKQHAMRAELDRDVAESAHRVEFVIGDVRNQRSLASALAGIQVVIHAAALKHVPVCEHNPGEAIATNIGGAENLVHAIAAGGSRVEKVVALSTDKACAPFSLMGMTKAIQERIIAVASQRCDASFVGVRMGNMLMSRGSIVPLFLEQIAHGGPVTVTDPEMTRFLITLDDAAGHVLSALRVADDGEIYVPRMRAASIGRIARELTAGTGVGISHIGARPGEKLADMIISRHEARCTRVAPGGGYLVGRRPVEDDGIDPRDVSSADPDARMTDDELRALLTLVTGGR